MCRCPLALALLHQGRLETAIKTKDFHCFGRGNPDAPEERQSLSSTPELIVIGKGHRYEKTGCHWFGFASCLASTSRQRWRRFLCWRDRGEFEGGGPGEIRCQAKTVMGLFFFFLH